MLSLIIITTKKQAIFLTPTICLIVEQKKSLNNQGFSMATIKTTGTILKIQDDSGNDITIGQISNNGLSDSGEFSCTLSSKKQFKLPDIHFTMDKEAFDHATQLLDESPTRIARYTEPTGEIYEGELQVYSEKQKHAEILGARMIAPKRIIEGVAHDCDVESIEIPIGALPLK